MSRDWCGYVGPFTCEGATGNPGTDITDNGGSRLAWCPSVKMAMIITDALDAAWYADHPSEAETEVKDEGK